MPTKGSVAFWHNLDLKGYRDYRNFHSGCPVLKGSKWIFNKWILSFDQFLKRPCSIDPDKDIPMPEGFY
jgi:prolyl 4-hydroxylase